MSTDPIPKLDPDELARLEEERDHLLASLEDLEREHQVGDMDDLDYESLRDDYTVRAADAIRAIESSHELIRQPRNKTGSGRVAAAAVVVICFAVAAGVMVARTSGQRGDNPITGSSGTLREQLATCQPMSFQKPEAGVKCYADILKTAPDNLEALTYQGWAYLRTDKTAEASANFDRVIELDPTYPDVRVFRAVAASRSKDFAKAAAEISEFYANDPSPMAVQVLQSQGLEREIFFGLMDPATASCWQKSAAEQTGKDQLDQQFFSTLASCLDVVLIAAPDDEDALVSRTFAQVGGGGDALKSESEFLDRVLTLNPENPNALLMRASIALSSGDTASANADMEQLATLPRPTISFLIGGPEQVSDALQASVASTTSTTVPGTDGSATATDAPAVPNPDGG